VKKLFKSLFFVLIVLSGSLARAELKAPHECLAMQPDEFRQLVSLFDEVAKTTIKIDTAVSKAEKALVMAMMSVNYYEVYKKMDEVDTRDVRLVDEIRYLVHDRIRARLSKLGLMDDKGHIQNVKFEQVSSSITNVSAYYSSDAISKYDTVFLTVIVYRSHGSGDVARVMVDKAGKIEISYGLRSTEKTLLAKGSLQNLTCE
jgi:hypothetical protein